MTEYPAAWQATLPERSRHRIVQALRQTLEAAVRWGYLTRNPARLAGTNPQPSSRQVEVFTLAEIDALEDELGPPYGPLPAFAAAGLRGVVAPWAWGRSSPSGP